MNTKKSAALCAGGTPTPEQLDKINLQSKKTLQAEEVYCFSVRLCDDQPDRDNERFDTAALDPLAKLFIGKTGICDHSWSAQGQIARIFDASTEKLGEVTILRAWAYMLRSEASDPIIEKIEAGIHKEVSISCSMGLIRCSICGEPLDTCEHRKGERYGTALCYGVLCDPLDAYEFSFVAVPAQPAAGVLKGLHPKAELEALQKSAALGERYLAGLRSESVRLALSLGLQVDRSIVQTMADALGEGELLTLNAALTFLREKKFSCKTQLPSTSDQPFGIGSEFLI